MDNTFKFSAYFKLYDVQGLQVSFSANDDEVGPFLASLEDTKNRLYGAGYRQTPEDINPGETVREVDGWVLGCTKDGDRCVHLYKSPLQWKVTTVYKEHLSELPIEIPASAVPIMGGAPERETAEKMKVMRTCDFRVVMEQRKKVDGSVELTDKGNPMMRYKQVYRKGTTDTIISQNGLEKAKRFTGYSEPAQKMIAWAKKLQIRGGKAALSEELNGLFIVLGESLPGDTNIEETLCELCGLTSDTLGEIDAKVVESLLNWIPDELNGEVNPKHNKEYCKALAEIAQSVTNREQED